MPIDLWLTIACRDSTDASLASHTLRTWTNGQRHGLEVAKMDNTSRAGAKRRRRSATSSTSWCTLPGAAAAGAPASGHAAQHSARTRRASGGRAIEANAVAADTQPAPLHRNAELPAALGRPVRLADRRPPGRARLPLARVHVDRVGAGDGRRLRPLHAALRPVRRLRRRRRRPARQAAAHGRRRPDPRGPRRSRCRSSPRARCRPCTCSASRSPRPASSSSPPSWPSSRRSCRRAGCCAPTRCFSTEREPHRDPRLGVRRPAARLGQHLGRLPSSTPSRSRSRRRRSLLMRYRAPARAAAERTARAFWRELQEGFRFLAPRPRPARQHRHDRRLRRRTGRRVPAHLPLRRQRAGRRHRRLRRPRGGGRRRLPRRVAGARGARLARAQGPGHDRAGWRVMGACLALVATTGPSGRRRCRSPSSASPTRSC